jgi:DNA polymerase-1
MMMKTQDPLLIIDGNNYAHKSYHAYSRLSYKGQGVSVIFGMPSIIKSLIFHHEPKRVIIVWDGNKSKHRLKALPKYKDRSHKVNMDYEDFLIQKAIVQKMFTYLGVTQVLNPEQEADDLIAVLVSKLGKRYKNIIIASGDKDFHQLLSKGVFIWNDSLKQMITQETCKILFGYNPNQTVDYLTLLGDTSDNIPGYRGMGEKKSAAFLAKYNSIQAFLDSKEEFPSIDRNKLLEVVRINRLLIDLSYYQSKFKEELTIQFIGDTSKPKIKAEKFKAICKKFRLNKFMSTSFIKQYIDLRK